MTSHYMWNIKRSNINKLIYKTRKRFIDLEDEFMVAEEKG